jgi:DNA-binding transcriptional regulator YiaG
MDDIKYTPTPHDHEAFLIKARKRKGFSEAYDNLEEEYLLVRELLSVRAKSGLTQEAVAERMGTTKSAVSRLEPAGTHALSNTAQAITAFGRFNALCSMFKVNGK